MKKIGKYDHIDISDIFYWLDNFSIIGITERVINPVINNDNPDQTYSFLVCRSSISRILRIGRFGFIILPD